VLGGLIAVLANLVLWPSWQPEQVRRDLADTIAAHAAYARAVLLGAGGDAGARRRQAGLSSNNLEASLQRAMHEPRRGQRDRLQTALLADAALRRLAGRLAAISLDPPALGDARAAAVCAWVPEALAALASGVKPPPRPAEATGVDAVDRLARQVDVLAVALEKAKWAPA
jgi:uncharacterized membrane protein YccC